MVKRMLKNKKKKHKKGRKETAGERKEERKKEREERRKEKVFRFPVAVFVTAVFLMLFYSLFLRELPEIRDYRELYFKNSLIFNLKKNINKKEKITFQREH